MHIFFSDYLQLTLHSFLFHKKSAPHGALSDFLLGLEGPGKGICLTVVFQDIVLLRSSCCQVEKQFFFTHLKGCAVGGIL